MRPLAGLAALLPLTACAARVTEPGRLTSAVTAESPPPPRAPAAPSETTAPTDLAVLIEAAAPSARAPDFASTRPHRISLGPPPTPSGIPKVMRQAGATGALDTAPIRRVVQLHRQAMRACYQDAVERNPAAHGKLTLRFTILGDGSVGRAEVTATEIEDVVMHACVVNQVREWRFPIPPNGVPVIIHYPFVFALRADLDDLESAP